MGSKWGLPWPTTTIDRIEQLGNVDFTFEKLRKNTEPSGATVTAQTDSVARNFVVVSVFKLIMVILKDLYGVSLFAN